ncbi:MAG TPA: NAD-dependent epimerase [Spirochaetota bacterium]|nr:NAD-dependent epimerase [Spirochaetota bacterium]
MKILVTGTAGFIGSYTVKALLEKGHQVVGLDSINDYYDPELKYARLAQAGIDREDVEYGSITRSDLYPGYSFIQLKLEDREGMDSLFMKQGFDRVCHLAAQAGVRYSLENPRAYTESNITGFMNILEPCREHGIEHLVFASSSSVYGLNEKMPFSTSDNVDHPVSLYAATKKSNELMAHAYSHLYRMPVTGLRFFTVYGPWGRPDMAYFKFTRSIAEGKAIDVYNNGDMMRDFTYIDDIVEGVVRVIDRVPSGNSSWNGMSPDPGSSKAPYKIYNIGNNRPVKLLDFIKVLEHELGIEAKKNFLPMQPGDVYATYADVDDLAADTGYRPSTPVNEGLKRFVSWYREYYGVK